MSPKNNLLEEIDQVIFRTEHRINHLRWHVSQLELAQRESEGARRLLSRRELDLKRALLRRAVLAREDVMPMGRSTQTTS